MSVPDTCDGRILMNRFGIGGTPLVPIHGLAPRGQVWLKAEYANPYGGVKDRTAAYLLAWAAAKIGPDVTVVESTSGNLGLALAHLGDSVDIPVTLVMDASLPAQRIEEVRRAGASVRVVDSPRPGMTFRESRIATARELGDQPGWVWLNQYANDAGVHAHEETTGPEIWNDLPGQVDVVVASVGTGGTICGIAAALEKATPRPVMVGVEPVGSTISGGLDGEYLPAGSGMRGCPEIINRYRGLVDLFAKVPDQLAAASALDLLRRFGIEVGQTTGAATAVAAMLAAEYDARVVVIAPDHGHAFRTAMRSLASALPTPDDAAQIQINPFGTDAVLGNLTTLRAGG
jgi:cysteine synthase A